VSKRPSQRHSCLMVNRYSLSLQSVGIFSGVLYYFGLVISY